jgi:hypothetical protein
MGNGSGVSRMYLCGEVGRSMASTKTPSLRTHQSGVIRLAQAALGSSHHCILPPGAACGGKE